MRLSWILALTLLVPSAALAQDKPEKPKDGKISLQLEDAELGDLVRAIGEITGKRFVIASPKLAKVRASVYAPEKVSAGEAYQAFLAVLTSNGLTVVPEAGFFKITESQDIARQLTPIERGDLPREERYVTRIQRLTHLSATDVAHDVLSKIATKDASIIPYPAGNLLIITETAANQRRMLEILAAIDEAREEDKLWFQPLRFTPAKDAAKQLEEILDLKKNDAASGPLHVAKIVGIERPNALAIVATRESYERIRQVIEKIDPPPDRESQIHVVMLQHTEAKKIVGAINEALGNSVAPQQGRPGAQIASPLEGGSSKVAADETTNSLIVTSSARDFAQIRDVITALDKPKRQVYIEAAILDISAEKGLDLGFAWHGGDQSQAALGSGTQTAFGGWRADHSTFSNPATALSDVQTFTLGATGPSIPSPIPGITSIPSFGILLTTLATDKSADIISTPHIVASDNQQAELKVQLQTSLQPNAPTTSLLPSLTGLPSGAGNINGSVSQNYKGIGPAIKVTPHLNDSDEVRLDIDELISDVQNAPGPNDVYGTISYLERAAKTTLTVKDGETVVIAGLMRSRVAKQHSKVPILGDIPVLGALFRTTTERSEKSNLVLMLTPHIIRDETDRRRIAEHKWQEQQEMKDREAIFGNQKWEPPKDWSRKRGVLAEVRKEQLDVARRVKEEADRPPADRGGAEPQAPLDLPTPRSPSSNATSPSNPTPTVVPARPSVVEH